MYLAIMKEYIFTSARLGFRRWLPEDEAPFAAMNANEAVMEFFPNTLTPADTRALIDRIEQRFSEQGYGLYAVDLLETGAFIGFIGFSHPRFEASFTPCVEIGWRLRPEVWNAGLATEGAKRCLQYGFEQLGLEEIVSFTAVLNQRSERIMQKAGMTFVTIFDHPSLPVGHPLMPHVLYKKHKPNL
ncbi:RimJ/RimL family protein N-acetyltransferase [Chitinophaga dinghuensis]|uniref:RimJ/RimL family protein N-acetyltransferase n=2 Tax=Chitinophaga dinghuensis TaxID=1539050 RepID=A0A327VW38_9BACT|nr:RimJ/RimL family protein N-acetyltransferase [Chitinophaga dinghuensis]